MTPSNSEKLVSDDVSVSESPSGNDSFQQEPELVYRPELSLSTVKHYFVTRVTDLIPPRQTMRENVKLLNPVVPLRAISTKQWLFIISAFLSFTWELFDFFTVSLNVKKILADFDVEVKQVTFGIMLLLLTRSAGAVIFGILGDKYGRKAAFLVNLSIMCILEIGTGFIKTFKQFLLVRALFGLALGGVFGSAAAQTFDDCPVIAKDFIGGFFQQGYTFGYLLAVIFTRAIADTTAKSWRAVYWFAAGISFLLIIFRALLPDTDAFLARKELNRIAAERGIKTNSIGRNLWLSFKNYWYMIIYMVLMMVGFNFLSHGTQDLFPTMLTNQLEFSDDLSTVTNCLANIGAIVGGLTIPHLANLTSRRFIMIVSCCCVGCLIYPWGFVHNNTINASVFFLQFFVQGAWGLVPSHLNGLAPDANTHAFYVGLSYQLGNMASSASSTIETTISERFPIVSKSGAIVFDYGRVMSILVGSVLAYLALVLFLGPEKRPVVGAQDEDVKKVSSDQISV